MSWARIVAVRQGVSLTGWAHPKPLVHEQALCPAHKGPPQPTNRVRRINLAPAPAGVPARVDEPSDVGNGSSPGGHGGPPCDDFSTFPQPANPKHPTCTSGPTDCSSGSQLYASPMTRALFALVAMLCLGACPPGSGQPDGGGANVPDGGTGGSSGGSGGSSSTGGGSSSTGSGSSSMGGGSSSMGGGSSSTGSGSSITGSGSSSMGGSSAQHAPSKVLVISHNETGSLQQVKAISLPGKVVSAVPLPQGAGAPIAVIASRDGTKIAVIGSRDDGMGNISDFSISLGDVSGPLQQATIPWTSTLSFLDDRAAAWYRRAEDLGVWSPDKSRLALAARYIGPELSRIFVVDANGANVTEVDPVFGGGSHEVSRTVFWTADSSALVFLRQRNLLNFMYGFDVGAWTPAGGGHIYNESNSLPTTEAAVRPGGGDRFAFVQAGRLFLARASETTANEVTPSGQHVKGIGWSPDGQRLAFITAVDGSPLSTKQIVVVNADGTNLQAVTFGGSSAEKAFAFSPDSMRIAYLSDEVTPGHTAVFEMSATAPSIASRVQLSGDGMPGAVADVPLAWSADSQRVAFGWRAAQSGPMSLKIATQGMAGSAVDGSSVGTVVTSGAKWSPNGHDALGYTSKETSGLMFEHLWMVSGAGGEPVDVGLGLPVLNWWWSRNNVLVGWLQSGGQRVVMAVPGATQPDNVILGTTNEVLVYVDAN